MDTSKIEEIGVDAVRHYINSIACARPFISTNDKTPLWDGSIFVYKNEKFKNEELDFFVHVQVKSHDYAKKAIPDTENHQVRLKDLEQYEMNGGLVDFVVDSDSAKGGHVFYVALTKTRIRNLIKNAEGKQGRSISLKAVPENTNEFLNDIHTVALQSEYPILSLPQLMGEKGWTYEITAERVPVGTNFLDYIATHSVTMLVSRKGDANKYFVDGISSIQFRKKIEVPIYVGQDKYFDYYYSTSTPNGRKIEIGEALSLLVPYFQKDCDRNDENGKIQMHINFQPICSYFQGCYYLHYSLKGDCTVNYDSLKLQTNDDNLLIYKNLSDKGVHTYKLRKEGNLSIRLGFTRKDSSIGVVDPLVLSILPSDFITYNGQRITDDTLRVVLKPGLKAYR